MSNHESMSIDDQTLANIMNKRHRSAKSQLMKNPPQPKFCIKEMTSEGRELYINVLSYSRIAAQLSEFDPIPLYGGMEIRSYSSIKSTAYVQQPAPPSHLIFAVMASPEVLKRTGRNCADTQEQMNLVELMCEFVEAMNPGIILSKKPEILKDKDLAGELKDVWSAVQNFRDKEKAGISDIVVYTEFGPKFGPDESFHPSDVKPVKSETHDASKLDQYLEHHDHEEKCGENEIEKETSGEALQTSDGAEPSIEIEKLSLGDKKNNENHHNNESSEKNVKIQNQRNKESQHHFFPKFLSSSKEKEKEAKDKEKEKPQDEQEPKTKTKKSLNFFRRNKSSASSPTHTSSNNNSNNQKSDSNPEH